MHICLFDIDGTLLDTGGAGQAAMEVAIASEFGTSRPVEGVSTAGRTDRAIVADLFAYFGVDAGADDWDRFLAAYLQHLPESLGDRQGAVLPGVPALLERLSERDDVLLGLLTGNYRRGAQIKLSHYDLNHHFDFDLSGFGDAHLDRDDVARAALDQVHKRMNGSVDLERVWVIGDTPADVRCARAIGANIVAVGTGLFSMNDLEAAAPDHLFDDFADPEPLLSLLE